MKSTLTLIMLSLLILLGCDNFLTKSDGKSDDDLIAAMIKFPILIERPIVKTSKGAVICRPPKNVLSIL